MCQSGEFILPVGEIVQGESSAGECQRTGQGQSQKLSSIWPEPEPALVPESSQLLQILPPADLNPSSCLRSTPEQRFSPKRCDAMRCGAIRREDILQMRKVYL